MFIYSPKISDDLFFLVIDLFHGRIDPPGSAQLGGPKAAPFGPLDFLKVGGPFREVGGPRPTLDVW